MYSTEKIKQIMDDMSHGSDPDMNPFWHGQPQYRDAGVAFEYTDEELEELDKCANDCMYFVKNYCKFKNDKGVTLVKLRDYQERLLNILGAEQWDEVSETVIPKNPKIVLMQSRQTGKCVTLDAEVEVRDDDRDRIKAALRAKYGFADTISALWHRFRLWMASNAPMIYGIASMF